MNILPTKTALHRTRLRNLDQEIFSVLIFYKTPRRAAPRLGLCEQAQTEKIEKNFSVFQIFLIFIKMILLLIIDFKVFFVDYALLIDFD
ncbi:hypothetical protein RGJ21_003559 [Serratia marcescens]